MVGCVGCVIKVSQSVAVEYLCVVLVYTLEIYTEWH